MADGERSLLPVWSGGDFFFFCNPSLLVFFPPADERISVKVNESGWAWMVCGESLIIWKICQTAVAKVWRTNSTTYSG